jgi:hypothetical protein
MFSALSKLADRDFILGELLPTLLFAVVLFFLFDGQQWILAVTDKELGPAYLLLASASCGPLRSSLPATLLRSTILPHAGASGVLRLPHTRARKSGKRQRWLGKFERRPKGSFCLTAAVIAAAQERR